ncbi:Na+/H+ antiporter family protein [Actinomyces sp.]
MLLLNAVVLSVIVMLALSLARVHVVISLFVASVVAGLVAGMGITGTMVAFQTGLAGGAKIALSYALLGAFAMAVAHSGLPTLLARAIVNRMRNADAASSARVARGAKWGIVGGVLVMGVMSQNLIPIHIAFIPLLIPPLIGVMNELKMDRRMIACAITFGIVTAYMFFPIGFGRIFLHDILYKNINDAGMDVSSVNPMAAMAIPAASMAIGCAIALFFSYRKPRTYEQRDSSFASSEDKPIDMKKVWAAVAALVVCFVIQTVLTRMDSEADPLLVGSLVGLCMMLFMRVVPWQQADDVFSGGMKMMSLIGLIMITAQGYASVLNESGQIKPLVDGTAALFNGSKVLAAIIMLLVGLVITMGIGSSFSTLPIISAIYVPLCLTLGFSPMATVAIIGTAGALGDAGSPASDSTLGPTAGLNVDGQHDHMRDTVIPTFLHYNVPLLIGGWVAAMVL